MSAPGQNPGQPAEGAYNWRDLIAHWVEERGTLSAVAYALAERRGFSEDVESVERGLRRLRQRGHHEGGVWGQRLLRGFGLPSSVSDRVRWMGQYHTRFTDLPASLALELLRPWERPPVSESPARIWLLLARLGLALRQKQGVDPILDQLRLVEPHAEPAAQIELALARAYALGRRDLEASERDRARAGALLEEARDRIDPEDWACLFARWVDQTAYHLNKPREGAPDHRAAEALYLQIPEGGPLFARCRRENGLGWSRLKQGRRAAAEGHARASVSYAGDAGSLRMRAMALNLLAATLEGGEAEAARSRALSIARRLEDEALRVRFIKRERPKEGERERKSSGGAVEHGG